MILKKEFFQEKTVKVAQNLIGCYLCCKVDGVTHRYQITETEAYVGPHDLASHSSKGRTKRTEVMYGEPGTIYVYLVYGMHYMLNVVTEERDHPSAVLIRGVEGYPKPAVLTKALGINLSLNNMPASKATGLWFEAREEGKLVKIKRSERIGVDYAGPIWSKKKLRFNLK